MADMMFAFEVILIKEFAKFKVSGDTVGIYYGFFVGVLGIISLSIFSMTGAMAGE